MLSISKVAGGQRNVTIQITGELTEDMPLTPVDLGDSDRKKIVSLVWLIEEKMGLRLWWDKDTPLLPMESRNAARFDSGLRAPEKWDGRLWLSSFNFKMPPLVKEKWFFLIIDLDR